MAKEKTIAVFDMDRTLLDSGRKLQADVLGAFGRCGVALTPEQVAVTDWYALARSYGIRKIKFDEAFNERRSWEESLRAGEAPLFEDAIPCLEALASGEVILALLTKSSREYTQAKIDYHGLGKYFGERVAVTPVTSKDKNLEAIELVRNLGRESISKAYFIGDRPEDVLVAPEVAREFKLDACGLYLNREREEVPEVVRGYRVIQNLHEARGIILDGR